jgi:ribosomal-protein-alanine N-acetyltransferase
MITPVRSLIRSAVPDDYARLARLVHLDTVHVHRHLDWRAPLDWIGETPFLLLEEGEEIAAALACPVHPAGVAWIRLFAAASSFPLQEAWDELWAEAYTYLSRQSDPVSVAALPLRPWFHALLERSFFRESDRVVMLSWVRQPLPAVERAPGLSVRPMNLDDLGEVEAIDRSAFEPLWQNALSCLELAYRQAAVATVAELDGEYVGYQISTATPMGGHLARLAVVREKQDHGIGKALLVDLLSQFVRRGIVKVSVNTQRGNTSSLNLYRKLGFGLTGEEYPVYQLDIPAGGH